MSLQKYDTLMKVMAILVLIGGSMIIISEIMAWTSAEPYDPNYKDLVFGFTMCCSAGLSWVLYQRNRQAPEA